MGRNLSAKLNVTLLQEGLQTRSLGRNIFFSHAVDSTNNLAKKLAEIGACEGTVAIAEMQTAGRGRLDREWISPRGGLWFSIILKPKLRVAEAVKLVFVAGLAVVEVLHELYSLKAETKWPNDVLVNGKKICGILAEMNTTRETLNYVVVGVGVNANFDAEKTFPESLRDVATSLEDELGKKIKLEELFKALLERLKSCYDLFTEKGSAPILTKWKE